jgi:iron-sulfur cluster repair protein YtfE (RIC family)
MFEARPMPTLFGRVTAASAEHRHLASTLKRLHEACSAHSGTERAQANLLSLVDELLVDMLRHFTAEEADAYFGEIVRERPEVVCQVADLRAEHAELLSSLEALRVLSSRADADALRASVADFMARFQAHEQVEVSLMQTFLGRGPR